MFSVVKAGAPCDGRVEAGAVCVGLLPRSPWIACVLASCCPRHPPLPCALPAARPCPDATVEVWEPVPPPPAANASANATDGKGDEKAAEGKGGKGGAEAAAEPELRKRTLRVPLNLTGGFLAPGMNETEISVRGRPARALAAASAQRSC